jgi:hypothetical protein
MENQTKTPPRDYSEIDSAEKAQALYRAGKLEPLYLFPLELGGQPIPQNTLLVPIGVVAVKKMLDGTIQKMVDDGNISKYEARPEYKGNSFIPSKIKIIASHPEKPGAFNPTIDIW